ncbi:MAG: glycosyltransferase [Mucilaginibacter sp.]|uniref:glycosyltransferase family 4 protein n=1 Tax=Mucilaginibacter sp. TaxID=1882438 RepID=UPI0031A32829
MSKQQALVILSPGFPANEDDTACIPPQQVFVRALKQHNPRLNIVVVSFQYPFTTMNYEWFEVEVIALGGKARGGPYRLLTWQRALRVLKDLNKKYEITGLLSFWLGECALIGNRFARKNNLKHYCWMLGQDARAGNNYVKQIKPDGNRLIALSDFLVREFNTNYGIKATHVITPGVDTSLFEPLGTSVRDIDVMGAGSLIPLKQYELFINVIKKLVLTFPDIKAIICGKGPEMGQLQKQIIRLNLTNNIELKGELPHREVLKLMQRSKVFLHTSAYEGYGMVLNEALYAGAHVVSLVNPMDERHANHHVQDNAESIPDIIKDLLNKTDNVYEPVLIYPIQTVVAKVMALFTH